MALTQTYYNLLDGYHIKYGKNTFLLMQVGSFFEVYSPTENGTNIVSFSQICDLKIANKQEGYMAGFSPSTYIPRILWGSLSGAVILCMISTTV